MAASLEQFNALLAEVEEHKRLQVYHRRQTRAKMAELQRFCEEHGIKFTIVRKGGEDSSHGHRRTDPQS